MYFVKSFLRLYYTNLIFVPKNGFFGHKLLGKTNF